VSRVPTRRLAALLDEAGWSHAGLARRVNLACERRDCARSYTPTSVANWLRGMVPADPVPQILVELFTDHLRRPITLPSLGYPENLPSDLGLAWHPSAGGAVESVRRLWQVDLDHLDPLASSGWLASAFAGPAREWLLDWVESEPHDRPDKANRFRIGSAEIEVVWSMCQAFADADHRLGGGYGRTALLHYVQQMAIPLLDGVYTDTSGRQLHAATARLCDLSGFMAFDSGAQGLAQRYYIQALRLAQASGDRALGAHILADMAMQAQHLGDSAEAISLARIGQRSAQQAGSNTSLARCSAVEARAHARAADESQAAHAMSRAEDALDKACAEDEPTWVRFFTVDQLQAEFTYVARDLRKPEMVQRFAPGPIAKSAGMERRHLLLSTALAGSYLDEADNGGTFDVAEACNVLKQAVPLLNAVSSRRGSDALKDVRRRLRPYASHDAVQELDTEFKTLSQAV
jgi:hypothetical protein